ncbi:restriction endonuclease subunit S [Enterococcus asini]|uniref:restriction endonuclease subunit S n=1 Tax=Enterococcus asini TaxID=57732 RepID=UPI001E30A655|nr:restriction endonuclease subunit S [Enterococcus asini]MCD5030311.1 restriction endonuclease subunit S [Enterococcus asini]
MSKKSPQLRFEGFTDDWEERKLSTESTITAGGDIDKSKLKEFGEYPIFANALTNDGIVGYYDSYYRVEAPAVTVTGRGDVGHAKARKVNFTPVVRLLAVKSNHDVDFLENAINNHKVLVESTGVPQLTAPQLGNYKIFFPTGEEQEKIGSFFKQLDDTIALHQHKLDLLKEQKKGFLQKMFPKNGAKVPELRFAGFDDDWEQRKLGDLAEIKDSARIPNIKWQKEGVPYLRSSDLSSEHIKDGLFLSLADYMKYDKITGSPKKGDLIFASGGDIGLAIYKHDSLPIYVQGGSILYVKTSKCENLDGLFLKYSFASPKVKKYIRNASTGTSLKHFVLKPANALPISYPDLIEQEKIGSLLMQMDRTITLHQRKLDLLKEQKKGFLQKMFV